MKNIQKNIIFAWVALAVVLALLIMTFRMRQNWWEFIDIFFIFMAGFCHAMALSLGKINQIVGSKLERCSFIALLLGIIAFIGEWIAFQIVS